MFQYLQLRTSTDLKPTHPHVYKLLCPTWYGTIVVSPRVRSEKLFVFKVGWGEYLPLWVGDVFFNFKSLNTAFVILLYCYIVILILAIEMRSVIRFRGSSTQIRHSSSSSFVCHGSPLSSHLNPSPNFVFCSLFVPYRITNHNKLLFIGESSHFDSI